MLEINSNSIIRCNEIKFKPIKSSGPGGQNINKNSSAILLYFDIINSKYLTTVIKSRLINRPNKYITKYGKIIIKVNTYKSQKKNKSEAISRLIKLFKSTIARKKMRIKTSPKKSSIEKRLMDKRRNSLKKKLRKKISYE